MENLSHALVTLAASKVCDSYIRPSDSEREQAQRKNLLTWSAVLAGNFPDLDILFTKLLPPPLGYLLHHRGVTHTFVALLPQMLLLALILLALNRNWRQLVFRCAHARLSFVITLCLGFLLHLFLDWLNLYGIHPFYPFRADWFYADLVFIVEPTFWVLFVTPLALYAKRTWIRAFSLAPLWMFLAFFTYKSYLSGPSAAFLVVLTLAMLAYTKLFKASLIGLLKLSLASMALYLGGLYAAKQAAMQAPSLASSSTRKLVDVALSSLPAYPLCWSYTSIEKESANDRVVVRRGVINIVEKFWPALSCPKAFSFEGPVEKSYSRELFRQWFEKDCHFKEWLRFARIPYLDEKTATALDFRFSRSEDASANFTTLYQAGKQRPSCEAMKSAPQWKTMRTEFL